MLFSCIKLLKPTLRISSSSLSLLQCRQLLSWFQEMKSATKSLAILWVSHSHLEKFMSALYLTLWCVKLITVLRSLRFLSSWSWVPQTPQRRFQKYTLNWTSVSRVWVSLRSLKSARFWHSTTSSKHAWSTTRWSSLLSTNATKRQANECRSQTILPKIRRLISRKRISKGVTGNRTSGFIHQRTLSWMFMMNCSYFATKIRRIWSAEGTMTRSELTLTCWEVAEVRVISYLKTKIKSYRGTPWTNCFN